MIQFVIGESTLLPFGKLNTTITNEFGDSNANNRYIGHQEFSIDSPGVKNGIDYHTLTYNKRKINLDTVQAPAGQIITGIRFHVLNDGTLTIQARATQFDYETGSYRFRVCRRRVFRLNQKSILSKVCVLVSISMRLINK